MTKSQDPFDGFDDNLKEQVIMAGFHFIQCFHVGYAIVRNGTRLTAEDVLYVDAIFDCKTLIVLHNNTLYQSADEFFAL